MSTQSLFSKKNIESQRTDTRRGLMEELNLPPGVIAFVRKNARNVQIGVICLVILILGWVFYDYYIEMQEKKGASLLASALQTESGEQQVQVLQSVISEYGRTDAARWSKLELAHLDYKDGRFDAAAAKYKETIDLLPADNPLVPLTRLNLAQTYEQASKYDEAISQYNLLKKAKGFSNQAYLGLGRLYAAKQDPEQTRKTYEELLNSLDETADPAIRTQVEAKLASLNADKSFVQPPPEESKE